MMMMMVLSFFLYDFHCCQLSVVVCVHQSGSYRVAHSSVGYSVQANVMLLLYNPALCLIDKAAADVVCVCVLKREYL